MANPGPNIVTDSLPQVVTGGSSGSIIGNSATETVGFYGHAGVAQQSGGAITTVAGLVTALQALGLEEASGFQAKRAPGRRPVAGRSPVDPWTGLKLAGGSFTKRGPTSRCEDRPLEH